MGKRYFISGATRGIGIQLVSQLATADSSNIVIATARSPISAGGLKELASKHRNIHIIKLDISSGESIETIDSQIEHIVKDIGIDVYISNGAVGDMTPISNVNRKLFIQQYLTNTLGPLQIREVLHKYMVKAPTKHSVFVSSIAGQVNNLIPLTTGTYGQTKAALNHSVIQLSKELKNEGFTVVAVHPGVVDTDMTKNVFSSVPKEFSDVGESFKALCVSPERSASLIIKNVVNKITIKDSGKFFDNQDGSELQF